MKIALDGIAETLLIPARVRAYETMLPDRLINDPWAVDIIKQLELEKTNKDEVFSGTLVGTILRTLLIDKKVVDFIGHHPDGVVVNLGCGLDARYKRLNPPETLLWFDLDVAETMKVRQHFFEETDHYKMITSSMFDTAWMDHIPQNKPLMAFFEGVSMYFPETMMRSFIHELFARFPQADVVFDVLSKINAKNRMKHPDVKKYNAPFKWGINSAKELCQWDERIIVVSEESYMVQKPLYRWPLFLRMLRFLPAIRRMGRVIHICYDKQ